MKSGPCMAMARLKCDRGSSWSLLMLMGTIRFRGLRGGRISPRDLPHSCPLRQQSNLINFDCPRALLQVIFRAAATLDLHDSKSCHHNGESIQAANS